MIYSVNVSFDDGFHFQEGHFDLNAILLSGLTVTSNPSKMVYRTGERISYSGLVVTATYSDESTEDVMVITASYSDGSTQDVTALCSITPAAGKAFDPETDTSVAVTYSESSSGGMVTENISLMLTTVSFTGLTISSYPSKTNYRSSEPIDYSGLAVTASYSDSSTEDVTSSCSISPVEGKAFNPQTDTSVIITYSPSDSETESIEISLTSVTLSGLSVSSNPVKTAYVKGEAIDYTGLMVTASYSDSSTADVTSSCSISPRAGKAFDPDNDSQADITYSENGITETASIMLTEIYMTGLQVTSNPRKTSYKQNERISYAGLVVSANYSDGSSRNVTSKCSITPQNNKKFDAETDTYVEITYSQASCTFSLTPITLTSLAVATNPDTIMYSSGEAISYSGIVVTASYSDNSDDDVTDKCVFSPSSGKAFNPNTDTTVAITYTEGQNEQSCSLSLIEAAPMTLVVAAMPTKTSYNPGEALDYSGAVIQSQFLDGTTHTVTDYCDFIPDIAGTQITVTTKCAHPDAPHIFDLNNGYVDGQTWKVDASAFSDVYKVKAGHKYLLALDEHVGSCFKVMFTSSDVSNASEDVIGTSITDTNNPATYASVEYTPSSNGYLVVTKDSGGTSGIKTYLYDADCSVKNVTAQFTLTTVAVTALAVTKPLKTRYRAGEKFDYTGAIVTATYSDGSVINVTERATFRPANGSTALPDDDADILVAPVIVSYGGLYASFDVITSGIAIVSLSVIPPNKISYRTGEVLDYTGCKVIAVYWDGSEKDVTASAVFEPANGTFVNKRDIDETGNLPVSISYHETDQTLCSNVKVDDVSDDYNDVYDIEGNAMYYVSTYSVEASVTYLDTETGQIGTKTFNVGGFIQAMFTYPYGTADPEEYCLTSEEYADRLARGVWDVDEYVEPYGIMTVREFRGFTQVNGQFGYIVRTFHDLYPASVVAWIGSPQATIDRVGETFGGRYLLGETFVPLMTVYYGSHASYTLNLSVATLLPDLSFTLPEKIVYHYNERYEYTGYSAVATYSDGYTLDVTENVEFYPYAGWKVETDVGGEYTKTIRVSYTNASGDRASSRFKVSVIEIQRLEVTPPEKTSYRYGEAIDYTGVTVTAVYSHSDPVDVTSSAEFSPANGTIITEDMIGYLWQNPIIRVDISYTDEWNDFRSTDLYLTILTE